MVDGADTSGSVDNSGANYSPAQGNMPSNPGSSSPPGGSPAQPAYATQEALDSRISGFQGSIDKRFNELGGQYKQINDTVSRLTPILEAITNQNKPAAPDPYYANPVTELKRIGESTAQYEARIAQLEARDSQRDAEYLGHRHGDYLDKENITNFASEEDLGKAKALIVSNDNYKRCFNNLIDANRDPNQPATSSYNLRASSRAFKQTWNLIESGALDGNSTNSKAVVDSLTRSRQMNDKRNMAAIGNPQGSFGPSRTQGPSPYNINRVSW